MESLKNQLQEIKDKAFVCINEKFAKRGMLMIGEKLAIELVKPIVNDSTRYEYVTIDRQGEVKLLKNSQSAGWNVTFGINNKIELICEVADQLNN